MCTHVLSLSACLSGVHLKYLNGAMKNVSYCVSEFIPCMDKLFDEAILIGSGYTARETLR